ncbi:hypothetical protein ACF1A5_08285 [Streptomyces sp. NPDC014864]|uniref:hypothetical protein n=1 Tax=Streptomyces sp. NPDC014864 TaxID=3364924 RepID=UPI0036F7ABE6
MTVTKYLRPVLSAVLLTSVTACAASSVRDVSASTTTSPEAAETRRSAAREPVAAVMPDVIGGNAGRVYEQMSSDVDLIFKDASGQGRPVHDPDAWKICDSQPGPNQQIIDFPVVFEVVRVSESCKDDISK